MKHYYLLLLLCLFGISNVLKAEKVERVIFNYTIENFDIKYEDDVVSVWTRLLCGDHLPLSPAIPALCYYAPVPKGMRYAGYRITVPETVLICKNKLLAEYPAPICYNEDLKCKYRYKKGKNEKKVCDDLKGTFPLEKIERCEKDGFIFFPFEYNSDTKELFFTPTIIIDRIVVSEDDMRDVSQIQSSEESDEIISISIYNGDKKVEVQELKLDGKYDYVDDETITDPIDYVIIAYESLIKNFEPLLKWKTQKGLRCEIKSVESIQAEYSDKGKTTPERIKAYIYDMFTNHGTSYVLLGGDIPTIKAKMEKNRVIPEDAMIPTDLYYACFDQQFDWDANKNGILGEMLDNISMKPDIIVTRLPGSYPTHVKAAVKKIIDYEKNGNVKKNIFMTAGLLNDSIIKNNEKISDGEYLSEMMYSAYIKPNWDGSLTSGYNSEKKGNSLQSALIRGFGFIDIQSHGEPERLVFNEGDYFTTGMGNVINPNYSIVTTGACHTNAFDDRSSYTNPCLSQALMTQSRNGVVAYLGSSREGWGVGEGQLGPSQISVGTFYNHLFTNEKGFKNYGKIVSLSKKTLSYQSLHNPIFRWLQLSINPIGDPEMPIYTTPGKLFYYATVNVGKENISVDSGVDDCVICLTGELNGKPYQKVYRNKRSVTFNEIPNNAVICITKQNYKPYINELNNTKSQALYDGSIPEIIAMEISGGYLNLTLEIPEYTNESYLSLTNVITNAGIMVPSPIESNDLTIDIQGLNKGVYVLNFYVDGSVADSRRFVIR